MKDKIVVASVALAVGLAGGVVIEHYWQERLITSTLEKIEYELTPLTDWQIMELAIMKIESDFNPRARNGQYIGLFQIGETYVDECNRLKEEPVWVYTDAFIPERALEMFNWYQDNHNPKHDWVRAIQLHNPGGKNVGYSQKVINNMEKIRNYENLRSKVIEHKP